jgi:flagellar biosynthesis protein FlhG
MSNEQTDTLHRMMADESQRATVLAVTSGKGGVGKTNISANLSICLAASGRKVVLIDADLGLGNLDVIMNINSRYNLAHVVSGLKSLSDIVHVGPAGVEVVCGGSGLEELANLSRFQRKRLIDELDQLQNNSDLIIIDTGAGINTSVVSFCQASDHTLVVTTPEPTAMTDAYAMIKVLAGRSYKGRISLVVNMAKSTVEGKKIYRQIADVAKRFLDVSVYEAGVLVRDDRLLESVRMRQPVVMTFPRANVSRRLWQWQRG